MLTRMKEKSQVTIPKPVVDELGLQTGDNLEVIVADGVITLVPMDLYPRPAVDKLRASVNDAGNRLGTEEEVLTHIKELLGSMSQTSMSSEAFASAKQGDMELERARKPMF